MANIYIIPQWFFGYTIFLGILFSIITLIVGIYALKIYKLSFQRQSKIFGIGFILISISYLIRTVLTIVLFSKIKTNVISLSTFNLWSIIGLYSHSILFIIGLLTIIYMTTGVKSLRLYSLFIILLIISLIFHPFRLEFFELLSSVLFLYIIYHYLKVYIKNRQIKNLTILIAFILLLLTHIDLIFSVTHGNYYVVADIISLVSYLIILINLILISRKK